MLETPKSNIMRASLTFDIRFLLAQLHMDSLKDQTSPKAIKRTLESLITGSKALDKAYEGAMQRIEDQLEGFRVLAKQVLGWLTYAERLMSITEVQHAIAVEPGERKFDERNLVDVKELVSICAGLVAVDEQSNIIRLVYYTTQEHFERHGESLFPEARKNIAESCLTYLLYDDFTTGWLYKNDYDCNDGHDGEKINQPASNSSNLEYLHMWAPKSVIAKLRRHPFYEYAAEHWATHARHGVEDGVKGLFLEFARDDHKFASAAQVLLYSRNQVFMVTKLDLAESISQSRYLQCTCFRSWEPMSWSQCYWNTASRRMSRISITRRHCGGQRIKINGKWWSDCCLVLTLTQTRRTSMAVLHL